MPGRFVYVKAHGYVDTLSGCLFELQAIRSWLGEVGARASATLGRLDRDCAEEPQRYSDEAQQIRLLLPTVSDAITLLGSAADYVARLEAGEVDRPCRKVGAKRASKKHAVRRAKRAS